MVPAEEERMDGLDLLRTCRQIYTETALLPYKLNTFGFGLSYHFSIKHEQRHLKSFQRAQIVNIEVAVYDRWGLSTLYYRPIEDLAEYSRYNLDFLPALEHIRIVIFAHSMSESDIESCKQNVRKQLGVLLGGRKPDITFEVSKESLVEYITRYSSFMDRPVMRHIDNVRWRYP
jgi:hypothetical protein